jgi:ATP-dependent Clp protease ATP-binding subunit ClpA
LKRAIQREVETALAKRILSGGVRDGYTVRLDADREGSGLKFEVSPGKKKAAVGA